MTQETRSLPVARQLLKAGTWTGAAERCVLDYDGRFLRRKRLLRGD